MSTAYHSEVASYNSEVALYGLSGFNEITKCIINPLRDIGICLWVSFLGLKFIKFLGDYLRDGSLIMSKKLSSNGILADTVPESVE